MSKRQEVRGGASSTVRDEGSTKETGGSVGGFIREEAAIDSAEGWDKMQSRRPWRTLAGALGGLTLWVTVLSMGTWLGAPTRSERSASYYQHPRGGVQWAPHHPAAQATAQKLDFSKVHRELFPCWVNTLKKNWFAGGFEAEQAAFRPLLDAVRSDPNLREILLAMRDFATDNAANYRQEILALVRGWNEYMTLHEVPWQIVMKIRKTSTGPVIWAGFYERAGQIRVSHQGVSLDVDVLRRGDPNREIEMYLGETDGHGKESHVMAERVAQFTVQTIWPLMTTDPDLLDNPADRRFSRVLREDAVKVLSSRSVSLLDASATAHGKLVQHMHRVASKPGCGRTLLVGDIPWSGLKERTIKKLWSDVRYNHRHHCRKLTASDVRTAVALSKELRETVGVRLALQELAAWVAGAVAAHEARHRYDARSQAGTIGQGACPGCPDEMDDTDRAEVAAYLASMTSPGYSSVAVFQLCHAGVWGDPAMSEVLGYVTQATPDICTRGPGDGWRGRMRGLAERALGEVPKVAVEQPEAGWFSVGDIRMDKRVSCLLNAGTGIDAAVTWRNVGTVHAQTAGRRPGWLREQKPHPWRWRGWWTAQQQN